MREVFKSKVGFDSGGTLAKLGFAGEVGKDPLEAIARTTSTVHRELEFVVDGHTAIRFVVIPTHRLEETARSIRARSVALHLRWIRRTARLALLS